MGNMACVCVGEHYYYYWVPPIGANLGARLAQHGDEELMYAIEQ